MKTPYMNIKENQGFLIILVIVIAFMMLNGIESNAQVSANGLASLFANNPAPASAPTFNIADQAVPLNGSVNSRFIELKPVMAPCGNRLYFSRLEYVDGITDCGLDEDIWYTDYNTTTGIWSTPKRLAGEINNSGPNFVNNISAKGDTLVLGNRYGKKGRMTAGLSYSVKQNDQWASPRPLNIKNDYNMSEHANHYVSFQHHVIISAIERLETVGGRDLYVSFLDGEKASEPINLGLVVNTELEESSPYLSSDGRTLFFASKGHDGMGGFDIYMTTRLDDTWTTWSQPVNLGPAVNTSADEEHFTLTKCGKYGLFSRQVDASNVDLFRVNIGNSLDQLKWQPASKPVVPSFASL